MSIQAFNTMDASYEKLHRTIKFFARKEDFCIVSERLVVLNHIETTLLIFTSQTGP